MFTGRSGWFGHTSLVWVLVAAMGLPACGAATSDAAPAPGSQPSEKRLEHGTIAQGDSDLPSDGKDKAQMKRPVAAGAKAGRGEMEMGGAASAAPATEQFGYTGRMPAAPAPGGVGLDTQGPGASAVVTIDPNGRFATTYRPGHGHLAAFDSAVSRGIVPQSEKELVSEVGARYSPTINVPSGKVMAMQSDFERSKLAPSGGAVHLRVALQAGAEKPAERPHLSVHLVLDVSGSMAGESISRAREAAAALVDKLAATDDFSLVTFSSDAKVLVQDGPVGSRKASIKETISKIDVEGGTNISRGLELGYQQAMTKGIPDDAVKVVLLLSDGRPNAGITQSNKLSKLALDAFQEGVQTSSFGIGNDYDGALMSSIAQDGAGGYYYLRDAAQMSSAVTTEIDKRLDPAATAVEVRIRLKKDVQLLDVYGSRRLNEAEAARVRAQEVSADNQAQKRDKITKDRDDDTTGGMRFFIPAFAAGDAHSFLMKLNVPAGVGVANIASVELKYKDRVSKKNVVEEVTLKVDYADSDAASAGSISPSVARTVQGFAAGKALAEAAAKVSAGDRNGAAQLLAERESLLRTAAETLNEPLFLKDADRLARLRTHTGATQAMGDPLVLAMVLETASLSHMH